MMISHKSSRNSEKKEPMSKKVLIISSSPHKGGNSDKRYDTFANERGRRS